MQVRWVGDLNDKKSEGQGLALAPGHGLKADAGSTSGPAVSRYQILDETCSTAVNSTLLCLLDLIAEQLVESDLRIHGGVRNGNAESEI